MFRYLFFAFLVGSVSARAEISWSKERVELRATALDSKVTASYRFKNSGPGKVRVMSVDGGCSCILHRGEGAEVGSGESGIVEVDFLIGERTGLQERVITVVTTGAKEQVHRLSLTVQIDEVVSLHPRLLYWTKGEALASKRTQIAVTEGFDIEFEAPVVHGGGFSAAWESSPTGNSRVLVVTPESLESVRSSEIKLKGRHEGREKTWIVFVLVR
jgi:hypothetical protein